MRTSTYGIEEKRREKKTKKKCVIVSGICAVCARIRRKCRKMFFWSIFVESVEKPWNLHPHRALEREKATRYE